jgi:hypothetical protein
VIKPRSAAGVFRPEKLARRSKIPKRIRCKTGVDQQNVARSQLTRPHSVPSPTRANTALKALYSCRSTRPHTDHAMSDTGHPSTLGRRVRNGTNRPPTLITRHVRIGSKAGTFAHYSLWYAGESRLRERQRHCRFGFLVKHATSGRQKTRRSMARYRRCDTAFAEQNLLARVIILRFAGECA